MKKETIVRFVWPKNEVRSLLLADLHSRGIEIEGETSLSFSDMVAILEFWLPTMPQDETSGQGEREGIPGELFKGGQGGKNKRYV